MDPRCGRADCPICELERKGCVHQRKTPGLPEWDDGCFVCQPDFYERPRCPTGTCAHCNKPVVQPNRFCSWECHVAIAKADGAVEYLPNGLPARCITGSGKLLECEHGDHPTYLFPIRVEFQGEPPPGEEDFGHDETHALIYTDGNAVLTLHECNYHLFLLETGEELVRADRAWRKDKYRLASESVEKIRDRRK